MLLKKVDEETLKSWLQDRLSEERYQHSLGAQRKAIELARFFKLSPDEIEQASLAGLLHDCAKLMGPEALIAACQKFNIPLTQEDKDAPQTLHPFVGAEIVKTEFDIDDPAVLDAIRYHTTGRSKMSDVEKVVYIADKIEENTRNPLYTQKITALIHGRQKETLDQVVLYILDSTITFLIEKGQLIHTRTIDARNELVRHRKQETRKAHNAKEDFI
jgi:predicted HD superfamily hydrolase involved in NAD metabolism